MNKRRRKKSRRGIKAMKSFSRFQKLKFNSWADAFDDIVKRHLKQG